MFSSGIVQISDPVTEALIAVKGLQHDACPQMADVYQAIVVEVMPAQ